MSIRDRQEGFYALPHETMRNRAPMTFMYRNHRGEVSQRRVQPHTILFGANKWHPEPQYLIGAWDLDRQEERWFAVNDIISFGDKA